MKCYAEISEHYKIKKDGNTKFFIPSGHSDSFIVIIEHDNGSIFTDFMSKQRIEKIYDIYFE